MDDGRRAMDDGRWTTGEDEGRGFTSKRHRGLQKRLENRVNAHVDTQRYAAKVAPLFPEIAFSTHGL